MTASVTPFVVDASGAGANTRIDYHFAAQGGRPVKGSVVVEGNFSDEDIESLRSGLDEGAMFQPSKFFIPDLLSKVPANLIGDDERHVIDRITRTAHEADEDAPSADQIIATVDFSLHATGWSTETAAHR